VRIIREIKPELIPIRIKSYEMLVFFPAAFSYGVACYYFLFFRHLFFESSKINSQKKKSEKK